MEHSSIPTNFPGYINARRPQDVFVFFDDFVGGVNAGTTAEIDTWLATIETGSTVVAMEGTDNTPALAGGILQVTTGGTAADVTNLQAQGEAFHLNDGYPLYFETRCRITDISNVKAAIGLNQTDTTLYAGSTYGVVFRADEDGIWQVDATNASGTKSVNLGAAVADDTWVRLAFYWDGDDTLSVYYDADDDGVFALITTLNPSVTAHYVPQALMLTPSLEAVTGATATAEVFCVDYVYCAQQRYPASGNG